jgi:hypothetical protein
VENLTWNTVSSHDANLSNFMLCWGAVPAPRLILKHTALPAESNLAAKAGFTTTVESTTCHPKTSVNELGQTRHELNYLLKLFQSARKDQNVWSISFDLQKIRVHDTQVHVLVRFPRNWKEGIKTAANNVVLESRRRAIGTFGHTSAVRGSADTASSSHQQAHCSVRLKSLGPA